MNLIYHQLQDQQQYVLIESQKAENDNRETENTIHLRLNGHRYWTTIVTYTTKHFNMSGCCHTFGDLTTKLNKCTLSTLPIGTLQGLWIRTPCLLTPPLYMASIKNRKALVIKIMGGHTHPITPHHHQISFIRWYAPETLLLKYTDENQCNLNVHLAWFI